MHYSMLADNHRKPTVLILGAAGLLGSRLNVFLKSNGYDCITHSLSKPAQYHADISDAEQATNLFNIADPDVIINLVALTDVDKCEREPNKSYLMNVRTVENIVHWIKTSNKTCHLIHISSDQLYDGLGPHKENDVTLTNYYAFSKYAAEIACGSVKSTILRTNFFGKSSVKDRSSITDWIYDSARTGKSIQVFEDIMFAPISITTLNKMIGLCICKQPIGIYNLGSRHGMSKADFAYFFVRSLGLSSRNMSRTITSRVNFLQTYRPKDMRTDSSLFERELGIKLPELADEIKLVAEEYREVT